MKQARKIWTYLMIVGLALMTAMSYEIFVFPNKFAPSGINGICTMIQYVFGISVGYLSLLINIPLAFLVLRKVGRSMAGRSMLYVVSFSLGLLILDHLDLSAFAYETANGTSKILGPLVAGVFSGVSYSLLVRSSSTTGGMDFVAALIHKSHPEKSFFGITFLLNAAVAVISYFVYGYQIEPVILCILYSFLSSNVSEHILRRTRQAVRCEIITESPEALSQAIMNELHHGATVVPAKGMYSGKETNVLLCVVNSSQIATLSNVVEQYPGSFAVLTGVSEVLGNFKRLDPHGNRQKELLDKGDGHSV